MKKPIEKYKHKEKLSLKPLESLENLTKVCCPSCEAAVPSTNININDKLAKCDDCNGIFSFANKYGSIHHPTTTSEIIQPAGVELFHFQDELDISFDKPSSVSSIVLSIMFIFLGLEAIGIGAALSVPFLIYLSIPIFLSAVLTAIWVFVSRKNKMYVTIDEDYLSVVNRPVKNPLKKDKYYKTSEIDQIYVKKLSAASKDTYIVHAILNTDEGQKHIKLTPVIKGKSKAKYIEQEIERHLDITNRPVPEED